MAGRPALVPIVASLCLCIGCASRKYIPFPKETAPAPGGTAFYHTVASWHWKERDSLAVQLILEGDVPKFLHRPVPIRTSITDPVTGATHNARYYVAPDYLSIGSDDDWARIPLTPMAAQTIADALHCFLPTRKMVNDIYAQAKVRLEPVPMYAFRDSSITMWQHHLIIEGQRKGRKGLIAGIKKDVVISGNIPRDPKPHRVAIYGWHRLTGQPIQPLYTGHVDWYVDYSHGIRLVDRTIIVDGKAMDYIDVLKDRVLSRLLCDEDSCDFYRYDTVSRATAPSSHADAAANTIPAAAPGPSIAELAASSPPPKPSYFDLKEYEGRYQFSHPSTLEIAASPVDTLLYAIINKARYPLRPKGKDVFVNSGNDPVTFLRNATGSVNRFVVGKDTFALLDKAVSFPPEMWYPRMVPDPKHYAYHYSPPADIGDGLRTGSLDATGLDPVRLSDMVERIVAGAYPNVHSILILKDGRLVFEEYFYEYGRDSLQEMRSATKSVISALTGVAIHKGLIRGVQERLLPLFPEYRFANPSPLKNRITIQDLLDNQSGVNYDEAWDKSIGNENTMDDSKDWVKYTFDLPMLDTPGTRGRYNSGNAITLGRLVEKASGQPLAEFADENLFSPLGITHFQWNFKPDPSNAENFCQLYLTPREMAKFGLLFLQDGSWKGRLVIPSEWVKESTSKHSVVQNVDYGYLWWLKYLDAGSTRYYSFAAQGNGGQKIYVFRTLNLVVVTTGGNFNTQSPADELIRKYILPGR